MFASFMEKDLFYLFGFIENYYLTMRINLRKVLIEILIEFVFLAEQNLILVTSGLCDHWVGCWLVRPA